MKNPLSKLVLLPVIALMAFGVLAFPLSHALAQSAAETGLSGIAETSGLGTQDLRLEIANIIRIGLSFVGVLALLIVLYGGFVWMTAGGDEEKVSRAKKILVNGVVGLLIILLSWSITSFVIGALTGAGPGGAGDNTGGSVVTGSLGGGTTSTFSITAFKPSGTTTIRNIKPRITFTKTVDISTVEGNVTFYKCSDPLDVTTCTEAVSGTLSALGNVVSFVPSAACPDPNTTLFCFDQDATFEVVVTTSVRSSTGTSLTCTTNTPCTSTFTSGELIDTEPPTASMTLPDDHASVPVDSGVAVQALGTDDAEVSDAEFDADAVAFDVVPATGDDLTNVTIDSAWDTTGLTLQQDYTLSAIVSDIAGNTDSDSVSVRVRPAACFDGIQDNAETGLDCGGDSTSADYCGACAGSTCSTTADCSGGLSCLASVCTPLPTISSVTPANGAPGTFVTVSGSNFGTSAGSIYFTSASGQVLSSAPTCNTTGWTNSEVTVQVPTDAVTGAIHLVTSGGVTESTNDDNGSLLDDFIVDDSVHPNLCSLSPTSGAPTDAVTLSGENFGETQGSSTVNFGTEKTAGSYTAWSDSSITAGVPSASDGKYSVYVVSNGESSNALTFSIASTETSAPTITSISPSSGGIGRYVSLDGAGFGSSTGTVHLVSTVSGDDAVASLDFPEACTESPWSDIHITFIVPSKFTNGSSLSAGSYNVYVETSAGAVSGTVPFTVTSGVDSTPEVCSIDPSSGAAGDVVTLVGDHFGPTVGSVTFASGLKATVATWTTEEATVNVPTGVVSGNVTLKDAGGVAANTEYFTVTSESGTDTTPHAAAYAWSFSTGAIPDVPELTIACTETDVSGVPNAKFTSAVCVNAVVFAEFTVPMNEATLASAVSVDRCTGSGTNPCSTTAKVNGTLSTTSTSFTFTPSAPLVVSSTYRVTVSTAAQSFDGIALANDVSWSFATSDSTSPCTIERVVVSPSSATITQSGNRQKFEALPVSGCVVMDSDSFAWSWAINQSYAKFSSADLSCIAGATSCANAEALAEGTTDVTARERGSSVEGAGVLTINFTDPYINDYWPSCTVACTNAEVGASFNTGMDRASIETSGRVKLYQCANELCTNLTEVKGATASCTYETDANGKSTCQGFALSGESLVTGLYYRVVVSGQVKSVSGVALTQTNYGTDYSWTFRVNPDGTACAVSRIDLSPAAVSLSAIGDTSAFSATAYSGADSCSASGERVSASDYNWSWTDPISDANIDGDKATIVAEWFNGTTRNLVDSSPSSIPEGCTAECTSAGSTAQGAICGNSTIETGESCDDGNVSDGDGCSSSCLREGDTTCGNGKVERTSKGAGEDCDDGNRTNGDGCSSLCLAEGSRSVGATCGNGDIAADTTTLAGEQCDDGNATSGDGCSSNCLNEGSPTLSSIGGAICGNGKVESPAENCDDGNITLGDGCSSACLLEGSSKNYGSTCGDGTLGIGEECEDGNAVSGDGCSSKCLREGSSTSYARASFCGDGTVGTGEAPVCEVGTGADGNIDPVQVAKIAKSAVYEVSTATNSAEATVQVTEASSGLSTTSDLSLMCVAAKDTDCSDPNTYGVGVGSCCLLRPTATLTPSEGATGVCRNAALYGVFTDEMNTDTFAYTDSSTGSSVKKYRMYAKLDISSTGGVCPSDHTRLAVEPTNIFAKVLNSVIRLVTGNIVNASTGDCVVPISSYEEVAQDDGTFKVYLHYGALLASGGKYTLVVEGDDNVLDSDVDGVQSKFGVGMDGTAETSFTVGTEICSLDALNVVDTDTESPNIFTQGDEKHTFVASGVSYTGGTAAEIESVAGSYSWDITSWETDDTTLFTATQDATTSSNAVVATEGKNGDATVVASATITDDAFNVSTGDVVTGSADVTALLCENPWPTLAAFPWRDDAAGAISGLASKGAGWTNFSTYYCRDSGSAGKIDDLPDLSVVRPTESKTAGVLKEYLFEVNDGSGDAIGVRVISNPDYLSPMAWYSAQGFKGSPTATQIDGFAAVTDGRTTYIAAPNVNGSTTYSNIYAISYNDNASDNTKDIYNQLLTNVLLVTNVTNVGLCVEADGVSYTTTECSSDFDCDAITHQTCADRKAKLRRDTKRLSDLTDLRTAIEGYGNVNGECSATTSQSCTADSDCPGTETCNAIVPALSSGTYVPGFSSSVWSSWNTILGGALGEDTLVADPLDAYRGCGGSSFPSYDSTTCVNQTTGEYVCPAGSYAYHYKTYGHEASYLYGDLEDGGAHWYSAIDSDGIADGVAVVVGNSPSTVSGFSATAFCNGTVYGASSSCGDGIVGAGETCEIGQSGGTATACTSADGTAGTQSQICNSSCTGWTDNSSATCVTALCGDGVINASETCDDGSLNGQYGYCGTDCTYSTAYVCGDGALAGGEKCDCGSTAVLGSSSVPSDARAYGADSGTCTSYNGTYTNSPNASCAWDCSGPAAYCGDGNIDSGEECDGTDETYAGTLCSAGSKKGEECAVDADCGTAGKCGGSSKYSPCATGYTRTRPCDDAAGGTCTLTSTWSAEACTKIGSCGDGTVDPTEECDDGNTDSTDSCTAECRANVCGDSYLYSGVEECDLGTVNGSVCSSTYGSSCSACSVTCKNVVSSGAYCGDGIVNGSEYCDGSAVPYMYYDSDTDKVSGTCSTIGATIKDSTGVTFTCRAVGICNGGTNQGDYCTYATTGLTDVAACGTGYDCVTPACNSSCSATCPFSTTANTLELTPNLPGSASASSVLLYSYDPSSTATLPNAATITVPACTTITGFTGSISLANVSLPETYVVFVTDRSGSMDDTLDTGETRMSLAREVLTSAVQDLYTELGENVHIGLSGFSDYAGDALCSDSYLDSCSVYSGCGSYSCTDSLGFLDKTDESDALDRITEYTAHGATQTAQAFTAAKKKLDTITETDNVRKIIVLLSDGDPTSTVASTTSAATAAKDAGYEIYTVALTTESTLKKNMRKWSSNTSDVNYKYNSDNHIDYAYDGSTADEVAGAYESIIDSIAGITVSLTSSNGSTTYQTTSTIKEGSNEDLPWPEGFTCDGVNDQSVPIQITFSGVGQIELSDVSINYCAP